MIVTVTVDLSPTLAERFSQLPDRDRFATEAISERLARTNGAAHELLPTELGQPSDYPTREAYVAEAQRLALQWGMETDFAEASAEAIWDTKFDPAAFLTLDEAEAEFQAYFANRFPHVDKTRLDEEIAGK